MYFEHTKKTPLEVNTNESLLAAQGLQRESESCIYAKTAALDCSSTTSKKPSPTEVL